MKQKKRYGNTGSSLKKVLVREEYQDVLYAEYALKKKNYLHYPTWTIHLVGPAIRWLDLLFCRKLLNCVIAGCRSPPLKFGNYENFQISEVRR